MKKFVFTIAGIPLKTQYTNGNSFPPLFKEFSTTSKNRPKRIWHLESITINKNITKEARPYIKDKINLLKERFRFSNELQNNWEEKNRRLTGLYSQHPCALDNFAFYFNDPVEVNRKTRKIRHFYPKEIYREKEFDSRLIAFAYSQILALNKGMLLHCACVVKGDDGFLFFAKAGGGKSTVAKLSNQYTVLGDDIIAVRKVGKDFLAFSTPWKQKKIISRKSLSYAKIKAAFFLKKSNAISFKLLKQEEALVKFLSRYIHFFLYTEKPLAKNIFFTAADFFKTIPAYEMHFRKDRNFWPTLENCINSHTAKPRNTLPDGRQALKRKGKI